MMLNSGDRLDKKSLLFVDDEPNVLQAIRRMLRTERLNWNIEFAASGTEALELMKGHCFDLITSDIRMPGMSGVELLSEIRERSPDMIRMVLSGQSDKYSVFQSTVSAHQYLSKPCEPDYLKRTCRRLLATQDMLPNASLRTFVSGMASLPCLAANIAALKHALAGKAPAMTTLRQIVARDPAMSAKILQLVNSAFFGCSRRILDLGEALGFLGSDTLRTLTLDFQLFREIDESYLNGLGAQVLTEHGVGTGFLADRIGKEICPPASDCAAVCAVAGLLHDTGVLVLAVNSPEKYLEALRLSSRDSMPLWKAETLVFGASHAEVGAYLLALWGFGEDITNAVAFHHRPQDAPVPRLPALTALHVADVLEHEIADRQSLLRCDFDETYLRQIERLDDIPEWRRLALSKREVVC